MVATVTVEMNLSASTEALQDRYEALSAAMQRTWSGRIHDALGDKLEAISAELQRRKQEEGTVQLTNEQRELDLYAENTSALYGQFLSIIKNLSRRIAKGTYDATKAPALWQYWYDEAARHYCKEFGGDVRYTFPKAQRTQLAEMRAAEEYQKITNGEYL